MDDRAPAAAAAPAATAAPEAAAPAAGAAAAAAADPLDDAPPPTYQLASVVKELPTKKLQEHVSECNDELALRKQQKLDLKAERLAEVERAKQQRDDADTKCERWSVRLERYRAGISIAPDEEIVQMDTGGENTAEATEFWKECDEDMHAMRNSFPRHAEMWWGPPPTDDQIKEAEETVAEAEEERRAATTQAAEDRPLGSDGEEDACIDDYEPETEGENAPQQGETKAAKRKRERAEAVEAMAPEERQCAEEAQRAKEEETARKRRQTASDKKEKLDAYPRLKKIEKSYKRAVASIEAKDQELVQASADTTRAKQVAARAQQKTRSERELFVEWLNISEGKGNDYDARRATQHFTRWYKIKNDETTGETKRQKKKKSAVVEENSD